jgi:hypothetical protein
VKKSGVLNREFVANLFNIPDIRIADFVEFDPGNAIKFTINRLRPSGSFGEGACSAASSIRPCWMWRYR